MVQLAFDQIWVLYNKVERKEYHTWLNHQNAGVISLIDSYAHFMSSFIGVYIMKICMSSGFFAGKTPLHFPLSSLSPNS